MKPFLIAQILCIALMMAGCSAEHSSPAASLAKTEASAQKPSNNWFGTLPSPPPSQGESIPAAAQQRHNAQPDTLATTSDLSKLPATSDLSKVPETSDLSKLAETSNLPGLPETSDLSK